jgi:hypothetical protein
VSIRYTHRAYRQYFQYADATPLFTHVKKNCCNHHFFLLLIFFFNSATVAADGQVRVSDVGEQVVKSDMHDAVEYTRTQAVRRVFKCHRDRVKRIVTESSPDLFLTVSEVFISLLHNYFVLTTLVRIKLCANTTCAHLIRADLDARRL